MPNDNFQYRDLRHMIGDHPPVLLKVQEVEVACLSVKDAAKFLGISPRSVGELKRHGLVKHLPKFPWSKEYTITLASLRDYVEANTRCHTPILSVVRRPPQKRPK